jgi:hypothetical protein
MNAMSHGLWRPTSRRLSRHATKTAHHHSSSSPITRGSIFRGGAGLSKAECEGHMVWNIAPTRPAACGLLDAVWST